MNRKLLAALGVSGWLATGAFGCANSTGLSGRQTSISTLKASVGQLQAENERLEKQVASLETENRRIENRLSRSENENGVLQARLEDNRKGPGESTEPGYGQDRAIGSNDDSVAPVRPPTTKKTKSTRRPPVAAIPGRIAPADPSDAPETDQATESEPIELGPQSYRSGEGWRPGVSVARESWQAPRLMR